MNSLLRVSVLTFLVAKFIVADSFGFTPATNITISNEKFSIVDSVSELWRYQVGAASSTAGPTPGEEYVCLESFFETYLGVNYQGSPRNEARTCGTNERFELIRPDPESAHYYLRNVGRNNYLQCRSGEKDLFAERDPDERCKFALFINDAQDRLYFYNFQKGTVITAWDDYSMDCWISQSRADRWESFRGWKLGTRENWCATDEYVVVLSLDNTLSPKDAEMTYIKIVGTQKSQSSTEGATVGVQVSIGGSLKKIFDVSATTTLSHEWSTTSSSTWTETTTEQVKIIAPAHMRTVLSQLVGYYGVFKVSSSVFKVEHFDAQGKLIDGSITSLVV